MSVGWELCLRETGTADDSKHPSELDYSLEKEKLFFVHQNLLSFQFDPTIRHTFWTTVVGGSWYWIVVNTNQNVIQRFLALKDQKTARKGSMIYVVAITILISMCIYNGLLLYATYYDCDPLTTKLAKADQLVPLLVMQTLKDIPGLPGLFIAGVFSGTVSRSLRNGKFL